MIPPRKTAKLWKPTSAVAVARKDAVSAQRYLGRPLWRGWRGYHRRSSAETTMHWMKRLGQSLMARDFGRQVAEIQLRIAVLNRYTAPGMPVTQVCLGKGEAGLSPDLCDKAPLSPSPIVKGLRDKAGEQNHDNIDCNRFEVQRRGGLPKIWARMLLRTFPIVKRTTPRSDKARNVVKIDRSTPWPNGLTRSGCWRTQRQDRRRRPDHRAGSPGTSPGSSLRLRRAPRKPPRICQSSGLVPRPSATHPMMPLY